MRNDAPSQTVAWATASPPHSIRAAGQKRTSIAIAQTPLPRVMRVSLCTVMSRFSRQY
jgi:hypothetical protein